MKFWAVLGSHGCREKKPPNCHNYATFWGGFFNILWAIFYFYFFNFLKNNLASAKFTTYKAKKNVEKEYVKIIINQK